MSIITIAEKTDINSFEFEPGASLLVLLRRFGYSLSAPCGGNGKCGKCAVFIDEGAGEKKVNACSYVPGGDCRVRLPDGGAEISWNGTACEVAEADGREGYGAAVDLGTTTVAVKLISLKDGSELAIRSGWNVQRSCGGDVISRIGYCIGNENALEFLKTGIRKQILGMIEEICEDSGIAICDVKEMFLAGNTVMQHIFAGIPPDSIASAPFTPESLFDDGKPVFCGEIPVYFAPCAAGYVGGDILAGILAADLQESCTRALFIDIGTNGEMVLGNKDGLVSCAVASGPAFEGAGISCGMPAYRGAVNSVELTEEGLDYSVLGGGEAVGFCGSGILDMIACLLELGYIDEAGVLTGDDGTDRFYLTDEVYIGRNDVRQIQLAKAAVAAGIELLLRRTGLCCGDIDVVYLAGGFGNRLRAESAVRIGMLPRELLGKIKCIGNSSLAGAQAALVSAAKRKKLFEIKKMCDYLELSSNRDFNDCFVDNMSFPEDDYEY